MSLCSDSAMGILAADCCSRPDRRFSARLLYYYYYYWCSCCWCFPCCTAADYSDFDYDERGYDHDHEHDDDDDHNHDHHHQHDEKIDFSNLDPHEPPCSRNFCIRSAAVDIYSLALTHSKDCYYY